MSFPSLEVEQDILWWREMLLTAARFPLCLAIWAWVGVVLWRRKRAQVNQ